MIEIAVSYPKYLKKKVGSVIILPKSEAEITFLSVAVLVCFSLALKYIKVGSHVGTTVVPETS